ncbi:MAG TPA: chromate transporter, partial [Candidatus Paceibacterota bacterium]|nr:chromate transporter [Candidatus Paceibacterota bacterium]
AAIGLLGARFWPERFSAPLKHGKKSQAVDVTAISDTGMLAHTKPGVGRAIRVLGTCLALWWMPVVLLGGWLGWDHALFREGIFFGKAAMVTFGGAYAVLPYVSQQAVVNYGWLSATQMLDGLGLAETTPGPLIMVLQFVGFLGGWQHPGNLPPLVAATLGAFITTWTTFVPCFLWIFLGAPHIEQMRDNTKVTAALSAVTAAAVGVILNLAVWFGGHVLFPDFGSGRIDFFALVLSLTAFVGLWRWNWGVVQVVVGAGILGVIYRLVGG